MQITENLIDLATAALTEILPMRHPADAVLSAFFRSEKSLGQRDRGFIAEAVYTVLRRKRSLERLCQPKPTARRLLLTALVKVGGLSQRQLQGAIRESEVSWLADMQKEPATPPSLGEKADLPDWLVERLLPTLGEDGIIAFSRSVSQSAPLDLRVNSVRRSRDEVLAKLNEEGIEAVAGTWSPLAIRLKGKPSLHKHPLFLDGSFEVQDEGSQLLTYLVAPRRGEAVADFCAGAGGKTLALGAMMRSSGRLYAFDVSEKRLAKLKPRLARSGLSNVHPVCLDSETDQRVKRLAGKMDRVLVDAPCSGLGTLRRNPDLKWRQSPQALEELTAKQASILASAARMVRPGGRLVYATCSILPEENEQIVAAFIAARPEFRVVPAAEVLAAQNIVLGGEFLKLSPGEHGTDGFFAAVLERAAPAAPAAADSTEA